MLRVMYRRDSKGALRKYSLHLFGSEGLRWEYWRRCDKLDSLRLSNSVLKKIISGGQTGADSAALDFAIWHEIPHGGWCPKGRLLKTAQSEIVDDIYWPSGNQNDSGAILLGGNRDHLRHPRTTLDVLSGSLSGIDSRGLFTYELEARGVEPLSSSLSTQTSTRLSGEKF